MRPWPKCHRSWACTSQWLLQKESRGENSKGPATQALGPFPAPSGSLHLHHGCCQQATWKAGRSQQDGLLSGLCPPHTTSFSASAGKQLQMGAGLLLGELRDRAELRATAHPNNLPGKVSHVWRKGTHFPARYTCSVLKGLRDSSTSPVEESCSIAGFHPPGWWLTRTSHDKVTGFLQQKRTRLQQQENG